MNRFLFSIVVLLAAVTGGGIFGQEADVDDLRGKILSEEINAKQLYLLEHLAGGGTMEDIEEPGEDTKKALLALTAGQIQERAKKAVGSMERPALEVYFAAFAMARGRAEKVRDMNRLKQLVIACHVYASDTAGPFPEKLDDLVTAGVIYGAEEMKDLAALSVGGIVYIGGLDSTSPAQLVLLHSPPFPDGKRLVAHVDGSVQELDEEGWKGAMAETMKHLGKPVPGGAE